MTRAGVTLSVVPRLPARDTLATDVAAGTATRHAAAVTLQWHVTTTDARTKLTRLYPSL